MSQTKDKLFDLKQILSENRTVSGAREDSKKRVFELISQTATHTAKHLDANAILAGLTAREKLGSTAIGHGVAIPHTRLVGLKQPIGIMLSLQTPIAFDALDEQPVDLFFAILIPEENHEAHLQLLSHMARLFQNPTNRSTLRSANSNANLYQHLISLSQQSTHDNNA